MMRFVEGQFLSITSFAISYCSFLCLMHTLVLIHLDTYRQTNTRNKSVNKEQTSDCHFKPVMQLDNLRRCTVWQTNFVQSSQNTKYTYGENYHSKICALIRLLWLKKYLYSIKNGILVFLFLKIKKLI